MKYPSKITTSAAVGKSNKFDLSFTHINSIDFGFMVPIVSKMMVPGDHFDCGVESFTRLLQLPSPTFSPIQCITRAFFVPFRLVMQGWNEFITQQNTSSNGVIVTPHVPRVRANRFLDTFVHSATGGDVPLASKLAVITDNEVCDFKEVIDGVTTKFNFTTKGRRIYQLLLSLGYNISRYADTKLISLLPLFCFYKFYLDWVVPARFWSSYSAFRNLISKVFSTSEIDTDTLLKLFDFMPESFLEDDFFTSAFAKPFGDNTNPIQPFLKNPSQPFGPAFNENFATVGSTVEHGANLETSNPSETYESYINAYTLKSIGALQQLLDHNMIADKKVQDYLKIEYGIEPNKDVLGISHYIGKNSDVIKIGDIFGTSDQNLGDFGGRGVGYNKGHFEYHAQEFGMFFVTTEMIPRTSYYQGNLPEVECVDRFDFYQPEFDNLGVEAIPNSLLNADGTQNDNYRLDSIFGFAPMYSKFKVGFDRITGDFRCRSLNTGLDSWYLARKFSNGDGLNNISINFCRAMVDSSDANNFDRIFAVANSSIDHFYQIHDVQLHAMRPMKQITESLEEFHEGKEVTVNYRGSNLK